MDNANCQRAEGIAAPVKAPTPVSASFMTLCRQVKLKWVQIVAADVPIDKVHPNSSRQL